MKVVIEFANKYTPYEFQQGSNKVRLNEKALKSHLKLKQTNRIGTINSNMKLNKNNKLSKWIIVKLKKV